MAYESIILKDISFSYGTNKILDGLNLTIKKGSIHSLIGKSGVGKSLTLKLMASLLPLNSGEILNLPKKISFAFQQSPLIPWLSVEGNLRVCSKNYEEISQYLEAFKLDSIASLYPAQLSGGMIQKVNILRSFLGSPDLILMDEPFVHIDSIQKEDLHHFLIQLWKKNRPTILFVTHDIDEAIFLSQEISLYGKKEKNIVDQVMIGELKGNVLELKKSAFYQQFFSRIYTHLKEEEET